MEADKLLRKQLVKHEDLWVKQIQPSISSYVHGYDEVPATPSRNYNATLYRIVGVPGIYSMYQSRDGCNTVARLAFEQYARVQIQTASESTPSLLHCASDCATVSMMTIFVV